MIRLHRLTKTFGSFTAVKNLSLELKQGEFFGFLGPNGAGKTTTIKMMTGLFAPTSGQILINGFDIQKNSTEAKLATGFIPDQPFLYEKLTGKEFLFFSAGLYKLNHGMTSNRIEEVIDMLELGSWIDRRAEDYSQGMRQRVCIAAALLHRPKVMVVDEPMVGLDPRSAHVVKRIFKEQSQRGVTIFMSTHSLPVAEELCDRIGIIKEGELIFNNTIDALHEYKQQFDGKFESVFLELTK